MNRIQAEQLIDYYKKFPKTGLFSIRPLNYPLFYLLECYSKGWEIIFLDRDGDVSTIEEIPFEAIAGEHKRNTIHSIYRYCALNPKVTNYKIGYVQEDLFSRYVGKLVPLKTPRTTWTYFPSSIIGEDECFFGKLGNSKLYLIQIDLNITDIIGKRNTEYPWHYLHQTIEWKPWDGQIPWQGEQHTNNDEPVIIEEALRYRF